MEQAEETATEPKTKPFADFRLIGETGIVEPELGQCLAQGFEVVVVDRVQPAINHRLGFFVTRQGRCVGRSASVTVSPMWMSPRSLIWAMK